MSDRHTRTVLGNGQRRDVVVEAVPASGGLWAYRTVPAKPLPKGNAVAHMVARRPRPATSSRATDSRASTRLAAAEAELAETRKRLSILQAEHSMLALDAEQVATSAERSSLEFGELEAALEAKTADAEALQAEVDALHAQAEVETKASGDALVDARAANEELAAANEELAAANEELATTADVLRATADDLTAENKELSAAAEEWRTKAVLYDTSAERIAALEDALANSQAPAQSPTSELRLRDTEAALKAANTSLAEVRARAEGMGEELEAAHAAADAAAAQILDLEREVVAQKSRADNAEDSLAAMKEQVYAHARSTAGTPEEYRGELEAEVTQLQQQLQDALHAKAGVEARLADAEGAREELEAAAAAADSKLVEAKAATREAEHDANVLLKRLEEQQRSVALAQRQYDVVVAEKGVLEASVADMKRAAEDERRLAETHQRSAEDAKLEVEALTAANTAAVSKLERDLALKNKDVLEASSRAADLQKRYTEARRELAQIKARVAELDKDVKKKNSALVAKRSQGDVLKREVEGASSTISSLTSQLEAARAELAAKDKALRGAQAAHQREVAELRDHVENLQEQCDEMDRMKEQMRVSTQNMEAAEAVSTDMVRQLSDKTEVIADLEMELDQHKLQLLQAADQLQLERVAAPRPGSAGPQAADQDFLSLSRRPDVHRLYVYTDKGTASARLVPVATVIGNDLLTNTNKAICRLMLQNQVALQSSCTPYGTPGEFTFEELQEYTYAFAITPQLCSEAQLREVFDAVNRSEADDGNRDTLDEEEFCEVLARLAVLYMPGDFVFVCTPEEMRDNPDLGEAFAHLLMHMQANKPAALDHLTFTAGKAGTFTSPMSEARKAQALALLSHAELRSRLEAVQGGGASPLPAPASDGAPSPDDTTAQLAVLAAERDACISKLDEQARDLKAAQGEVAELEAALEARAVIEATLSKSGAVTPNSLDTTSPMLGLAPLRRPERMFVRIAPRRQFPLVLFCGGEFICHANKAAFRNILYHQVGLQRLFNFFGSDKAMMMHELLGMAEACGIVPTLCSPTDVKEVFDSVNSAEEEEVKVDDAALMDALDDEEFNEALMRLAVFYAPGGFEFAGTMSELADSPAVAEAFQALLLHIEDNMPPELAGLHFPVKRPSPVHSSRGPSPPVLA